jgi:hypothetical protein
MIELNSASSSANEVSHHVGGELLDRLHRFVGVARLADDVEVGDHVEQAAQSAPDQLVVVAEKDADGCHGPRFRQWPADVQRIVTGFLRMRAVFVAGCAIVACVRIARPTPLEESGAAAGCRAGSRRQPEPPGDAGHPRRAEIAEWVYAVPEPG